MFFLLMLGPFNGADEHVIRNEQIVILYRIDRSNCFKRVINVSKICNDR